MNTTIERIKEREFLGYISDVIPYPKTAKQVWDDGFEAGIQTAIKILRREIVVKDPYDWEIGG